MHWIVFAVLVLLAVIAVIARVQMQRGRLIGALLLALAAVVTFEALVRTDTISARTASGWMTVVAIMIAAFFATIPPRLDRPH